MAAQAHRAAGVDIHCIALQRCIRAAVFAGSSALQLDHRAQLCLLADDRHVLPDRHRLRCHRGDFGLGGLVDRPVVLDIVVEGRQRVRQLDALVVHVLVGRRPAVVDIAVGLVDITPGAEAAEAVVQARADIARAGVVRRCGATVVDVLVSDDTPGARIQVERRCLIVWPVADPRDIAITMPARAAVTAMFVVVEAGCLVVHRADAETRTPVFGPADVVDITRAFVLVGDRRGAAVVDGGDIVVQRVDIVGDAVVAKPSLSAEAVGRWRLPGPVRVAWRDRRTHDKTAAAVDAGHRLLADIVKTLADTGVVGAPVSVAAVEVAVRCKTAAGVGRRAGEVGRRLRVADICRIAVDADVLALGDVVVVARRGVEVGSIGGQHPAAVALAVARAVTDQAQRC